MDTHDLIRELQQSNDSKIVMLVADGLGGLPMRLTAGKVRDGIERAFQTPLSSWEYEVAESLGCGDRITAADNVPFCLWMTAAHLENWRDAVWKTMLVGGDIDTNCAIVGGLVACHEIPSIRAKDEFLIPFIDTLTDPSFKTGTPEADQQLLKSLIVFACIMLP